MGAADFIEAAQPLRNVTKGLIAQVMFVPFVILRTFMVLNVQGGSLGSLDMQVISSSLQKDI